MSLQSIFTYNGVEFPFDAYDAEDSERMEIASEHMAASEKRLPKEGKNSEIVRAHCQLIKDYFDDIFGEGAGVAICTERSNLNVHYDAYDSFLAFVRAQKEAILERGNSYKKYSNRQQRRAAEKKKKN